MNIQELRVGDTIEIAYGNNVLREYYVITTMGKVNIQTVAANDYHAGRRHAYTIRYICRHNVNRNVSAEFRNMPDL